VAVTAQDVRETFSEFATATDALIDRWLDQANRRVNATQWGAKADDGVLWLTAHLLKLEKSLRSGAGAPAGPISSKKVDQITVTFKVPDSLAGDFLASTGYGQYFLSLRKGIFSERVLGSCT
jgi:hypothetical protein